MAILTWILRIVRMPFIALRTVLTALFGHVQWTPPVWLRWGGARASTLRAAMVERPGVSAAMVVMLVAAGAGGWYAWHWWQARPKPVTVDFKITQPARTEIENDGKPNPLVVEFARGVAPIALVGKEATQGITIAPAIAGAFRWRSDRILEFNPKDDWPVGTQYRVSLDREAVAPQILLSQRSFAFSSPNFVATIANAEFYQDPVDPALKKAVITLHFSHPVDIATLEKRISLQMAGASGGVLGIGAERTPFVVSYDKLKLNAFVHSKPLPIPKENTRLDITVDKGVAAARGGPPTSVELTKSVDVPGLYSLAIEDMAATVVSNDRNELEQVLVVPTSTAVHEKEMQKAVSAWLLPLYPPSSKPEERTQPYAWEDVSEVTDAVLKAATKLDLAAIPAERENTETHSFRYRADVGRYLFVQVDKGVKSFGGYVLGERKLATLRVPPFPPELKILSQGSLLAMSGERKVAVLVRDLPGIQVEIGRVLPGQLQHLVSQSTGNFATPEFLGSFGPDNLSERFERKLPLPDLERGRAHYQAVDLGEYLKKEGEDRRGIFLLTVRGYDPDEQQGSKDEPATDEPASDANTQDNNSDEEADSSAPEKRPEDLHDQRLILVTDLGVLMKRELDGTQVVFVQSIRTGQPVAGATVDVIARNGLTLATQATDAGGMARFPKVDGLVRERAPLMFLVRKAGDTSFLPLNRGDRTLDMSRFDVGGIANARTANQLDAYLFSDRGIYRPGDPMHIGMIVKSAEWTRPQAKSLAGLPLEAEVLDARGLTVKRERIRLAAGGFNELSYTTLDTAPTGTYTVNLYTVKDGRPGQQIGTTQVRVQEFEPDRMKVVAHLSTEVVEGWVAPTDLKARVNVQNLFGTPAENRRIETTLTLSPAFPAFRSYPDWTFYDPQRAKEGYSEKLADVSSDAQGNAEIDLRLDKYARATYRMHVLARAFEADAGRSVSAETATLVSELPFLVGYKADGDLGYVARGSRRDVALLAIDPKAQKTAADKLTLLHIERKFVSVLTRQESGVYKYESRKKEVLLKESPLAIAAAGTKLTLATDAPGNFAYVIRSADGLELNRIEYSVAGQGNVTRSLERNAELQLALSRKDYAPGDDIEINIRAPYTGAGLITIERDKVYAQQWFKADTLASVQKIKLPKDFEGTGYVSVQFVLDPASDEIFMSPLSWGVVPFATSLSQRTNALTLEASDLVKPGAPLKVKLHATQPTRAVVFAVDEGILQVARYGNADPLGHFFQKRALDVRTAQILDLILPEFRKLMAAAAPGGDEEGALGRHLNPFKRKRDKPAVYWSGIVDVKDDREFTYAVPETFSGTLRIMAVAVNETALGTAQRKSLVRGDFVLSPNVPAMVAPGDQFEVSVGVANNVAGSGPDASINVALAAAPALEIVGAPNQTLKVGEMREGVATYRLKVRDGADAQLGSATLSFSATMNGKSASLGSDLSVRPATPYYTRIAVGSFQGSTDVAVARDLFAEHRRLDAAVSAIPLVAAHGLTAYLADFPHSCTEQLVSQTVPAVVLAKRPEFARSSGAARGKTLDDALRELRARQNAEGGFGLWAASVRADEFASVYAIHLLLEARERGENVPFDMVQKGLEYLQQLGASPATDLHAARVRAYAAYLLTRQGTVTTPILTGLRETLDAKYPKRWQDDSVAAYLAASYQLQKQERAAAELIDGPANLLVKHAPEFRYESYYDPSIRDAQTLYLIARHFPQRARDLPPQTLLDMVKGLGNNRFNTLSAAYTILALDAYANTIGAQALGMASIAEVDAKGEAHALTLPDNLMPRAAFAAGTAKLRFGLDASVPGYYAITEAGFDRTPPAADQRSGLEVIREYVDAAGKPVSSVKLGDEITVRLRFRAIDRDDLPNVALVDLLPGGFEPVLQPPPAPDANAPSAAGNNASASAPPSYTSRLGRGSGWNPEYADIRDDRVVLYGSATRNASEYTYRIKATNAGTFVTPPAYGESLYERSVQARSQAGTLVVDRATK
ncbi:MAG TPA: alpha-2-macroglobulin [Casimicrobiaceae bacterium]|nr:alpha-2-macroglobulin [Casimicrobiaceae bacterium]